jgi:hypothetical protein
MTSRNSSGCTGYKGAALTIDEERGRHLAGELREWVAGTNGWFALRDIYRDLNVLSKEGQTAVRMALTRMTQAEPPKLERHPTKNGEYRVLRTVLENIELVPASSIVPFNIGLPFKIDEYCTTLRKNIILLAGSPNSGKTGFLLNVVDMNQREHDIHYFSSEMGQDEFSIRLELFEKPMDYWNFNRYERTDGFPEVIRPDSLNIIDYYEIGDNFYRIGEELRRIHEKLRNGIAIIALQKRPPMRSKGGKVYSDELGRGGSFSLEKPRLYLSMDSGKLKIVKAKLWKHPEINPNGWEYEFKLAAGCRFVVTKWPMELLAREAACVQAPDEDFDIEVQDE